MRRTLLGVVVSLAAAAAAQAPEAVAVQKGPPLEVAQPGVCQGASLGALPEGAASVGYQAADLATGRRACPRTEVGLGGRFGAIIDTANFYGDLGVSGVLFGSWALDPRWELYATLEAVNFTYVQTALKATQLTLGNLTVGASWTAYQTPTFAGAVSARLLLPTSLEVPGAHPVGAEVGHASTWRPLSWLEVHSWLGVDLTAALGPANGLPWVGGTLSIGAQATPFTWGAVVLDVTGRLGPVTYLAPTVALRFAIGPVGLEVGGSLPLLGTDRHDFLAALRLAWKLG